MSSSTPSANSEPSSRKEAEVTGEAGRVYEMLGMREIPGRKGAAAADPSVFMAGIFEIARLQNRLPRHPDEFEWEEEEKRRRKKKRKIRSVLVCPCMARSCDRQKLVPQSLNAVSDRQRTYFD